MIKIIATVLVLFVSMQSQADIVVANNPVADTVGFYSDGYDSQGQYFYAQSGAQVFSMEDSHTLSSVEFWGSMNGFNGQGLSNVDCIQVMIWTKDFSAVLFSDRIDIDTWTVADTGDYNFFGQPVYHFKTQYTNTLKAGTYAIGIGAILNDASGDQMVWSQGVNTQSFYYTSNPNWGTWQVLPLGIGNTAGGAFVLNAPAPGALALLGLGGLLATRRR